MPTTSIGMALGRVICLTQPPGTPFGRFENRGHPRFLRNKLGKIPPKDVDASVSRPSRQETSL